MEYRILGPLEVAHEGEPVPLGRPKERLVLAVLLLHANEFVSRERLIDELWGPAPPPTAKKAVNVYISQLRKALARTRRWTFRACGSGSPPRASANPRASSRRLQSSCARGLPSGADLPSRVCCSNRTAVKRSPSSTSSG